MEIRRYHPGEEEAIWKVPFSATRESVARDYHQQLIEEWAPQNKDMKQWRERLEKTRPFVAIINDEIVGMVEVEKCGFIDYFYVHPRYQKTGIGKALLAKVESEAQKCCAHQLTANVSLTAKSFFESQGFHLTEAHRNIILGHPAPNFAMAKIIHR